MVIRCKDCDEEFYMDMEFHNKKSLKELADKTVCPKCQSENWYMTDGCER